jgi:hypothetical protein
VLDAELPKGYHIGNKFLDDQKFVVPFILTHEGWDLRIVSLFGKLTSPPLAVLKDVRARALIADPAIRGFAPPNSFPLSLAHG